MSEALKNKLSNYEVNPPSGNWDRIASALDEGYLEFPDRLYRFEQKPPESAWQKIAYYLENRAQVVPLSKRYRSAIRYAGAAAALAAIIFFTWPLFNRDSQVVDSPLQNTITAIPVPGTREKHEKNTEVNVFDENKETTPLSRKKQSAAIAKTFRDNREKNISTEEQETVAMLDHIPIASLKSDFPTSTISSDNYMIYTDDHGNAMKLPKKLFDAFDCATKEIVCRQKIRDLQQRFASSAISTDFTGVLEILRNLQENQ